MGRTDWAALLVNRAIDVGYDQPDAYLKRARIRTNNQDRDGASEDAWRVLKSEQVAPPMVREAIQRIGSGVPKELVESTAVRSLELEEKFWLAGTFNRSLEDLSIAAALWEQILDAHDMPMIKRHEAEHNLGLSYMGLGRCSDAARIFRKEGQTYRHPEN